MRNKAMASNNDNDATGLPHGFYIQYTREEGGYTFTYAWDGEQQCFTRLQAWWTCYPTRFAAEEEYAARDFGNWQPAACIVRVE
jgi:hypothetical protein